MVCFFLRSFFGSMPALAVCLQGLLALFRGYGFGGIAGFRVLLASVSNRDQAPSYSSAGRRQAQHGEETQAQKEECGRGWR